MDLFLDYINLILKWKQESGDPTDEEFDSFDALGFVEIPDGV